MSRNGKVIVAMSGGVDSSVAASLLKDQGYDCIGVFMRTGARHDEPETCALTPAATHSGAKQPLPLQQAPRTRRLKHGCCSATDALDARNVAARLGIPFYALNFDADFEQIIDYFVAEYAVARTPNPCVMCNIHIKFGKLFEYADLMDAEFVATGHYARILHDDSGAARLARARNLPKDQSYVLFGMARAALSRCRFPLGDMTDKSQVRSIAADLGLRVHDKPDSQEICFVPDNDYKRLLDRRRPELSQPGEFRHTDGRVLGKHAGISGFTIGQRHGLGLAVGEPIYVTHLDAETNTVTVGPRDALDAAGLIAERMNWLSDPPALGTTIAATARIRHMHTPAACTIERRADESVAATFATPQSAVTPGQAAVIYDGDLVLGGGWISRPIRTDKAIVERSAGVTV